MLGAGPQAWYRARSSEWWLWWPCDSCGGARLPLMARLDIEALAARLHTLAADFGERGCPGCRTRRERLAVAGEAPEVWFDTILGDWVVRVPCGGDDAAILPLEIPCFDVAETLVIGVAAELVYAGDALIQEDE